MKLREQVNTVGVTIFGTGVAVGLGGYLVLREALDNGGFRGTGMELKDWSNIWLGALAFLFSLLAFFYNRHSTKLNAFLALHEKMIARDVQEGRRLLFTRCTSVEDVEKLKQECDEGFQKVNRALGLYDVLGMYVSRKYVYESAVLEEWGRTLVKARNPARCFMDYREKEWDHFLVLSEKAAKREAAIEEAAKKKAAKETAAKKAVRNHSDRTSL